MHGVYKSWMSGNDVVCTRIKCGPSLRNGSLKLEHDLALFTSSSEGSGFSERLDEKPGYMRLRRLSGTANTEIHLLISPPLQMDCKLF